MKRSGATAKAKAAEDLDSRKRSRRRRVRAGGKPVPRRSSAKALVKHSGTWVGEDAELLLKEVYAVRGKASF